MENFSNAIKCYQCKSIIQTPAFLPCCHSVCKKHETERTDRTVVCIECNKEYQVPNEGFPENKALTCLLASNMYEKILEIDFGPEHQQAVNVCKILKETVDEAERIIGDPINYVHERVSELKSRIDLAKEEFKLKIDEESDVILRNLEEYEHECKTKSKANDIKSKINEIANQLKTTKLDLDNWTKYFDSLKNDTDEFENIENKGEDSLEKIQNYLDSFNESVLLKKIDEKEEMVTGFEKLNISFDYKSPIKGERYYILEFENDDAAWTFVVLRDNRLAIGYEDGDISIWKEEAQTKEMTLKIDLYLKGHKAGIHALKELSDYSLASASVDKTVKIWNPQSGQLLRSLESHTGGVTMLEQLLDGSLVSGSFDGIIKIWCVNAGELLKTIEIGEEIYSSKLLINGNFVCVTESKRVIFDSQTKEIVQTIENNLFYSLSLLRDGSLAIGQTDSNITIWDVNTWKLLKTLKGHKDRIWRLKSLDDGNLVSGSENGEIKIWNPMNCQLLKTFETEEVKPIESIAQLSNGCLATLSSVCCRFWK